jgi:hypothetical protein
MITTRMSLKKMRFVVHLTLIAGLLSTATVANGNESDFLAEHARRLASNPRGMSFTVELVGRQTQFHVGELIPIDVVYRFEGTDSFLINGYLNERQHQWVEIFHVSPESGTRPMSMSTLASYRSVGTSPHPPKPGEFYRYRANLNQWRRFDKPGHYRFYDESARVWRAEAKKDVDAENDLRIVSNLVEIEITPASIEWQEGQLQKAVQVLDLPTDQTAKGKSRHIEALQRLRYLDTEVATRELAGRYSGSDYDPESHEIGMALLQSKYKHAAVEVLERRLMSPDFVVTATLTRELARLAAEVQMPDETSPLRDTARARLPQFEIERDELEKRLCRKYSKAAIEAAATKQPLARAQTLLERLPESVLDHDRDPDPPSAEFLSQIREAVIPVFDQLTTIEQMQTLGQHWKRFGGKGFLPVLRRLIAAAPAVDDSHYGTDVLDLAFRRLWELAPEEGTAAILDEIRRPRPRATIATFKLLPDLPIPELDDLLVKRMRMRVEESDRDQVLAARILARYGSPAVYDDVRKAYRRHRHNWGPRPAAMLAYLIRHNPKYGSSLLKRALNGQKENAYPGVFAAVAEAYPSPALEQIAIECLNDLKLEITTRAVSLLGDQGSPDAELALWDRLEKLHAAWRDHKSDIPEDAAALEHSLVYAISHSSHWITDKSKLSRLRTLCVTKASQDEVDHILSEWREPIEIRFQPGLDGEFYSAVFRSGSNYNPMEDYWWIAGQYHASTLAELKTLIARLPSKVTFQFPTGMLSDAAAEQKVFEELLESLTLNGQKLVRKPRDE